MSDTDNAIHSAALQLEEAINAKVKALYDKGHYRVYLVRWSSWENNHFSSNALVFGSDQEKLARDAAKMHQGGVQVLEFKDRCARKYAAVSPYLRAAKRVNYCRHCHKPLSTVTKNNPYDPNCLCDSCWEYFNQ